MNNVGWIVINQFVDLSFAITHSTLFILHYSLFISHYSLSITLVSNYYYETS